MKTTLKTFIPLLLALVFPITTAAQLPGDGLRVHLKADAGTSATTNGAQISTWLDQSGNGHHASQSIPGFQPTFVENGIGGMPSVRFWQSVLNLPTPAVMGIQNADYEVFFVARSSNTQIQFLMGGDVGHFEAHLNGLGGLRTIPNPSASVNHSGSLAYSDGIPHIFSMRVDASSSVARVNGQDVANPVGGHSSQNNYIRLGVRSSGELWLYGEISEIIIYNRVLTSAERADVERYLQLKYDLLPSVPRQGLRVHLKPGTGETASNWSDVSGNGFNATNATPGDSPTPTASGINGLASMSFDGTDFLRIATPTDLGIYNADTEFFVVARSNSPDIQFLFGGGISNHELHLNGASGQRYLPRWSLLSDIGSTGDFTDNQPRIFSARGNTTEAVSRVNGLETLVGGNAHSNDNTTFQIGRRTDNSYGLNGQIAEVLVYNRNLSSDERQQVERYLQQKYNIAAANLAIPRAAALTAQTNANRSAFLSGLVNPRGTATDYYFAYGTDRDALTSATTPVSSGSGTTAISAEGVLSELTAGQTYYVTLVASNAFNTSRSDTIAFTMAVPTVTFSDITSFQTLSASTVASINPNGFPTQYYYKWGTTRSALSDSSDTSDAITGTETAGVSRDFENMFTQGTTYYMALKAFNSEHAVWSDTLSFNFNYSSGSVTAALVAQDNMVEFQGLVSGLGFDGTARFVYSWNEGAAQDSTETVAFLGSDVDKAISVMVPLPVAATDYKVRLVATNAYQRFVSEEFTFNNRFSEVSGMAVSISSNAPSAGIRVLGTLNHGGNATSYRFFYGLSAGNLNLSSDLLASAAHETQPSEGIDRVLGGGALSYGSTYYVAVQTTTSDGNIWRSDTLQVVFRQTELVAYAPTDVLQGLTASVSGLVRPNGFAVETRWIFGTNRNNLDRATAFEPVGSPTDITWVTGQFSELLINQVHYYALQARWDGFDVSSDTLSFDTFFSTAVFDSVLTTPASTATLYGTVNTYGRETYAQFVFGTSPESLFQNTSPQLVTDGVISVNLTNLAEAQTYYAAIIVQNDHKVFRTSTRSFNTNYPVVTSLTAEALNTSSIRVSSDLRTNNLETRIRLAYGTSADALNDTTAVLTFAADQHTTTVADTITGLQTNTEYFIQLLAENDYQWVKSQVITGTTSAGPRPTLTIREPVVGPGNSLVFKGTINPNGHETTIRYRIGVLGSWEMEIGAPLTGLTGNSVLSADIAADSLGNGRYFVTMRATNPFNTTFSDTLFFTMFRPFFTFPEPAISDAGTVITVNVASFTSDSLRSYLEYGTQLNSLSDTTTHLITFGDFHWTQTPLAVSATLTGLEIGSKIYYRAVTTLGSITVYSPVDSVEIRYFSDLAVNGFESTSFGGGLITAQWNPNGFPSRAWIEYGVGGTYQVWNPNQWRFDTVERTLDLRSDTSSVQSGTERITRQFEVSEFTWTSTFQFQLVIEDTQTGKRTISSTAEFTQNGPLPVATLNQPQPNSDGSVRFTGSIDPRGESTSYQIVWGTDRNNLDSATEIRYTGWEDVAQIDTLITEFQSNTYYASMRVENYNVAYSDTLEFVVQIQTPPLTFTNLQASKRKVGSDRSFILEGTAQGSGAEYALVIYAGYHPDTLQFASEPLLRSISNMEFSVGSANLPKDTTYYYALQVTLGDNVYRYATQQFDVRFADVSLAPFVATSADAGTITVNYDSRGFDFDLEFYGSVNNSSYYHYEETSIQEGSHAFLLSFSALPPGMLQSVNAELTYRNPNGFNVLPRHDFGIEAPFTHQIYGTEGWRMMSSPMHGATVGQLLADVWTQGFEGARVSDGTPNVYLWSMDSSTNAASNWVPVSSANQIIPRGTGLLVYLYQDDNGPGVAGAGAFPKTLTLDGLENYRTVSLQDQELNPNTNGWSLKGNPFSIPISWNTINKYNVSNTVYLWENSTSEWKTWNGMAGGLEDGIIQAFSGFFMYTTGEGPSMDINRDSGSLKKPQAGQHPPEMSAAEAGELASVNAYSLSIKVTHSGGLANTAWFTFNAEGQIGLDPFDAYKLAPYSATYVQLASLLDDRTALDINNLPLLSDQLRIPLHLNTTQSGTFSFTLGRNNLAEGWDYVLEDTETGARTRLSTGYTFEWTRAAKAVSGQSLYGVEAAQSPGEEARFYLILSSATLTTVETHDTLPTAFSLEQNYPNPFNPSTTIRFALPENSAVRLEIFDLSGRVVQTVLNETRSAGYHQVEFNGAELSSGLYFYRLQTSREVLIHKMMLLK